MDELQAYYTPRGAQLSMTGDDWTSDRDKKAQARAEAARKKAGLACAKKLEAAADALYEFLSACNECRDGSGSERMGECDGRTILRDNIREYARYLDDKFGRDQ